MLRPWVNMTYIINAGIPKMPQSRDTGAKRDMSTEKLPSTIAQARQKITAENMKSTTGLKVFRITTNMPEAKTTNPKAKSARPTYNARTPNTAPANRILL
jgi:hypothetical protein